MATENIAYFKQEAAFVGETQLDSQGLSSGASVKFQLPQSTVSSGNCAVCVIFRRNLYTASPEFDGFLPPLVDARIYDSCATNARQLSVSGLGEPVRLIFQFQGVLPSSRMACQYWDQATDSWS